MLSIPWTLTHCIYTPGAATGTHTRAQCSAGADRTTTCGYSNVWSTPAVNSAVCTYTRIPCAEESRHTNHHIIHLYYGFGYRGPVPPFLLTYSFPSSTPLLSPSLLLFLCSPFCPYLETIGFFDNYSHSFLSAVFHYFIIVIIYWPMYLHLTPTSQER